MTSKYLRAVVLLIIFSSVNILFPRNANGDTSYFPTVLTTGVDLLAGNDPEEYRPDEFNSGLLALRRGEIIFFGSVPVTFILSGLGWQLSQAAAGSSYPFSDSQHTANILLSAAGFSLTVAVVDFILGFGDTPEKSYR